MCMKCIKGETLTTVNEDGSYEISSDDLDELPLGKNASSTFVYRVKDVSSLFHQNKLEKL